MSQRPLLFISNSAWNLSNFRGGVIRALLADGLPVAAAVPVGSGETNLGIPTLRFPLDADGTHPMRELRSLVAITRLLQRVRPAAVFAFTPKISIYAGLAGRIAGIPVIPNISGLGRGVVGGGVVRRVQLSLYRPALSASPAIFFQNTDDRAFMLRKGLVRSEQTRLLPGSGVDLERFVPLPLRARKSGAAHLLFVGRLLGDKGVRLLAEAMRSLRPRFPDLQLTLAGFAGAANPSAITAAEVRVWESEGLLRWTGPIDDVAAVHAGCDALILPSFGGEGVPRSLLEGAASGRPLLATDVPGCRDLVRDGENGLLFAPRSLDALCEAIERFLNLAHDQRVAMARAARKVVEQEYGEELVIAAYRRVVMEVTGNAG